jgi:RNA polymerase sigma factor (sigma-70 family)
MTPETEEIKAEIENALGILSDQRGEDFTARIRPILYANLDRGRIQGFIEGEIGRVQDYVLRVAEKYDNLSPYMKKLQSEESTNVWEPLIIKLQGWAYNYLRNNMLDLHPLDIAQECANEAAITILGAHFPYDTEFEPWAHVLVKNICSKFIHKATKGTTIPRQSTIHIDDNLESLKDPQYEQQERQQDLQDDLLEAIAKLSNGRRQVIVLKYLQEYSLDEIAQKMGKSIGAIYCLHFNALSDLRKILSKNEDNVNE